MSGYLLILHSIIKNKDLTTSDLRVLLCLKCYKPSFPSLTRIQEDASLSRATVVKSIKNLVRLKLVSIKKKGNSFRSHNMYEFNENEISYFSKNINHNKFNKNTSQVHNLNSNTNNKIYKKNSSNKIVSSESSNKKEKSESELFDKGEEQWILEKMKS